MNPRASQLFHAFAQGFVQTPFEFLVLIIFISSLVLVVSAYLVVQAYAARRRRVLGSQRRWDERVAALGLEEQDTAIIIRMAARGGFSAPRYVLLENRRAFDACARKMLQAGEAAEVRLNALRLKLGFRITRPEEAPDASAEIPEGSRVVLQTGMGSRYRGTLVGQGPAAMVVKVDSNARDLSKGWIVALYYFNPGGVFSFPTRVVEQGTDTVHLEHSSAITRHQRRRYYRRKELVPASICAAFPGATSQECLLIDIGAGGAAIEIGVGDARAGDLLEVSLPPSIMSAPVQARVLRVSGNGRVIGVKFEHLSEANRNRIAGFVFSQDQPPEIPAARAAAV